MHPHAQIYVTEPQCLQLPPKRVARFFIFLGNIKHDHAPFPVPTERSGDSQVFNIPLGKNLLALWRERKFPLRAVAQIPDIALPLKTPHRLAKMSPRKSTLVPECVNKLHYIGCHQRHGDQPCHRKNGKNNLGDRCLFFFLFCKTCHISLYQPSLPPRYHIILIASSICDRKDLKPFVTAYCSTPPSA